MKIIVGMSGGVDSSVAAWLLKQQGHDVTGVFMQNWQADNDDPHCTAEQDLTDARAVADKIGIPLKTVSFANEYWDRVFQYFLDEYAAARTPNPDILCNKEIKFKAFLDYALDAGADAIATGHYVRRGAANGHYQLLRGLDNNKDQSYFLYTLQQHALAHALFPVGELEKSEVRRIAQDVGLITHNKKDSTGICFIGERKFKQFLNEYLLARPGKIVTPKGDVIGEHAGLMFYTLGQRQGLNIGGLKHYPEAPWYVLAKNIPNNELIAGQDHNHPLLMHHDLTCNQVHWISDDHDVTSAK
ncbi:MAG: tRNA 2-thiouridine(34) synthase MnmA, partial [Coxiellaceae bacterium]|nr:tRNA 2-thiouridine(34) synthase MnmA [Coxiellaceae bacterium]